jgi:hypothetical protein
MPINVGDVEISATLNLERVTDAIWEFARQAPESLGKAGDRAGERFAEGMRGGFDELLHRLRGLEAAAQNTSEKMTLEFNEGVLSGLIDSSEEIAQKFAGLFSGSIGKDIEQTAGTIRKFTDAGKDIGEAFGLAGQVGGAALGALAGYAFRAFERMEEVKREVEAIRKESEAFAVSLADLEGIAALAKTRDEFLEISLALKEIGPAVSGDGSISKIIAELQAAGANLGVALPKVTAELQSIGGLQDKLSWKPQLESVDGYLDSLDKVQPKIEEQEGKYQDLVDQQKEIEEIQKRLEKGFGTRAEVERVRDWLKGVMDVKRGLTELYTEEARLQQGLTQATREEEEKRKAAKEKAHQEALRRYKEEADAGIRHFERQFAAAEAKAERLKRLADDAKARREADQGFADQVKSDLETLGMLGPQVAQKYAQALLDAEGQGRDAVARVLKEAERYSLEIEITFKPKAFRDVDEQIGELFGQFNDLGPLARTIFGDQFDAAATAGADAMQLVIDKAQTLQDTATDAAMIIGNAFGDLAVQGIDTLLDRMQDGEALFGQFGEGRKKSRVKFLRETGHELIADGIKNELQAAAMAVWLDPRAPILAGVGAAEIAVGLGMGATGAIIGRRNGIGSDTGAGGSRGSGVDGGPSLRGVDSASGPSRLAPIYVSFNTAVPMTPQQQQEAADNLQQLLSKSSSF